MKKRMTLAATAAALLASTAWAGYTYSSEVSIDTTNRTATGSLGSARNSADTVQMIGCYAYATGSSFHSGYCFAKNASGVVVNCMTQSANHIEVIKSLNSDSYLYFSWDVSGNCSTIYQYTDSRQELKAP